MTAYQGGKKRIGNKIYNVICLVENNLCEEKLPYFEPFVGMAGVLKYFAKDKNRSIFACDANIDLIMLWKKLQLDDKWKPPLTCSKKKYEMLKTSKKHSAERAFIGITASWGCIFFRNYRLHYNPKKKYLKEGWNGLVKIKPYIKHVKFLKATSYDNWSPENMLIYCDPPYKNNNLGTELFTKFDSELFWEKMRIWSKNNIVIISESSAPKDFKEIWRVKSSTTNAGKTKKYDDCLFVYKTIYKKICKSVKNEIKEI